MGIRAVGAVWLLVAAGFVLAGFALWRGEPRAVGLSGALAVGSLILCVLGLPDSGAGILVNVGILAVAAYTLVGGTEATWLGLK